MSKKTAQACLRYGVATVTLGAALVMVANYYFSGSVWSKCFGLFDVRYYYGPNAYFLDTSLARGEFPLWNPLIYCGVPFIGDPQTGAFYPFQLLRSLLTPAFNPFATAAGVGLLTAAHVLLGGVGCLRLCRAYRISMNGGMVAAFIFMFFPLNILFTTEYSIFPLVTAWAPWLLVLAHRALMSPSTRGFVRYASASALIFGVSALAAFPQLTLYLGLLLAAYVILHVLLNNTWRPMPGSHGPREAVTRAGVILTLVAVGGALIASVVLLPASELAALSARPTAAGMRMPGDTQTFGWAHLLTCLVVFPGDNWHPYGSRAAGIGSILAFLAACWHPKKRDVFLFIGVFVFFTDLTLGPPLPFATLLRAVDPFNITLSPQRAGVYQALALAVTAGFGVDSMVAAAATRGRMFARATFLAVMGAGMLGVLAHWLTHDPQLHAGMLAWLLPVMTLVAWCGAMLFKRPVLGRRIVAALICFEILNWAMVMLPIYVSRNVGSVPIETLTEEHALWDTNYRGAALRPNWNMWTLSPAINGYLDLFPRAVWETLCTPGAERYYRRTITADDVILNNLRGNLFAKRAFWLAPQWAAGPLPDKGTLYPSGTTVFLTDTPAGADLPVPEARFDQVAGRAFRGAPEIVSLGQGAELNALLHDDGTDTMSLELPAFDQGFVHSVLQLRFVATEMIDIRPVCTDEKGRAVALGRCFATDTNGQMRTLEMPLPDCERSAITLNWPSRQRDAIRFESVSVLRDPEDGNKFITALSRRANGVFLAVEELPGPRVLLFVDTWYPGWHAYVDGKPVEILRANDSFKAVLLEAGSHRVLFEYRPVRFLLGVLTSGIAAALLVLLFGATFVGREKGKAEQEMEPSAASSAVPTTETRMQDRRGA